jgi:hypothetical protein
VRGTGVGVGRRVEFRRWVRHGGLILFLIGCAMFVVAGIRARDLLSTIASGLFFLGCVFFLIPMFKKR